VASLYLILVAAPPRCATGSWLDGYSVCSSVCPANTGETDAAQYWTENGANIPLPSVIIYKCSSISRVAHTLPSMSAPRLRASRFSQNPDVGGKEEPGLVRDADMKIDVGATRGTWQTDASGKFTQPDLIRNCSQTCEDGGNCSEDWQQTFTTGTTALGIINGKVKGTLNCITTSCTSDPQGITH